jgi:hypothetical protein
MDISVFSSGNDSEKSGTNCCAAGGGEGDVVVVETFGYRYSSNVA